MIRYKKSVITERKIDNNNIIKIEDTVYIKFSNNQNYHDCYIK